MDTKKLLTFIKDLQLELNDTLTYVEILYTLNKFKQGLLWTKLFETNSRDRFDFPAPVVNAFYDPTQNQIGLF